MTDSLKRIREQVDQWRAEQKGLLLLTSFATAYERVLGLIDAELGKSAPPVTFERHYTDAEIKERLDTAGSHPHGDARDVEMLRQVFEELHRERRMHLAVSASSLLFTDAEKDAMAAVGVAVTGRTDPE